MTDDDRPAWAQRLQTERDARGWGKYDMARHLLAAIGITRPDPRQVKNMARQILNWEKGLHFPRDWADAYATALGIPAGELLPTPGKDPAVAPAGTLEQGPAFDQGDDEVKRRAALQLIAALGAGTAIPPGALETVLSDIDDALGNPLDLDEWDATVHEYGQLLTTRPAGALAPDLTADLISVGGLLKRPYGDHDKAALMRVSAGLSGLLAIDLADTGNKRAARISWSTAKRAADASGDRDLRVWARGRAAEEAVFTGRPASVVVTLADEAVQIANGASSGGLARAHAARAYAATDQGDTRQAEASLASLSRTFDQLSDTSGEQTPLAYRQTQLLWAHAYVQALTGDSRADQTLTSALALYPPSALAPITNLSLMRAAMLVKSREIDAGLQHAVASLHPGQGRVMSAGARMITSKIIRDLPEPARSLPAARELRELAAAT